MDIAAVAQLSHHRHHHISGCIVRNPLREQTEANQRQSKKHFRTQDQTQMKRKEKQNIAIDSRAALGQNRSQNLLTITRNMKRVELLLRSKLGLGFIFLCRSKLTRCQDCFDFGENILLHQVISERKSQIKVSSSSEWCSDVLVNMQQIFLTIDHVN